MTAGAVVAGATGDGELHVEVAGATGDGELHGDEVAQTDVTIAVEVQTTGEEVVPAVDQVVTSQGEG